MSPFMLHADADLQTNKHFCLEFMTLHWPVTISQTKRPSDPFTPEETK